MDKTENQAVETAVDNRDMEIASMVGALQHLISDCKAKNIHYSSLRSAAENLWQVRNNGEDVWEIGSPQSDSAAA